MVVKRMIVSLLLACMLVATASAATAAESASPGNTAPLTSPPPVEVQPFSVWDPNHVYLDTGWSVASDNGNHVFKVDVTTVASTTVSQIGAKLYIEKWTGSTWALVGSVINLQTTNRDDYVGSHSQVVLGGYYYRARTIHWIQQGAVYEEGQIVGGSVYVN
ncbi:hypothetical protein [Paenibacillus sp. HJGM_3]|uniref:hypothetical protein n=1 Tax=Paenibacillus sp. HJGM_3 TaxID=3379816 RepID=UPI00385F9068